MGQQRPSSGYMSQLDGIRAIAVVMVMVFHWHHPTLFGDRLPLYFGVDIFFVLSGFLITRILVRVRDQILDRPERPSSAKLHALKAFWVRRFLRLVPALLLYLAVAIGLGLFDDTDGLLWYLGYLGNFRINQLGYWPSGGGHLWSLAVEEQFYILMPLVVLWLPRRFLSAFFGAGIVLSIAVTAAVDSWARLLPPAAFTGLFIGCLTALMFERYAGDDRITKWCALGAPGVVLTVALGPLIIDSEALVIANDVVLDTAAAAMTWRAALGRGSRVLEHPVMTYLGRISYGLYLWHLVAQFLAWNVVGFEAHWALRLGVSSLLSLALAALSDVCLERRFIAKKSNYPYVLQSPNHVDQESSETVSA